MSFFSDLIKGKKRVENWTETQMLIEELIENDVLDETRQRLVLKYMQTGYGSKNYVMDYGNTGAAQLFQYRLGGQYDYHAGQPTVVLGGAGTPISAIQEVLNTRFGKQVIIQDFFTISLRLNVIRALNGMALYKYGYSNLNLLIQAWLCDTYPGPSTGRNYYDFASNRLVLNGTSYWYYHKEGQGGARQALPDDVYDYDGRFYSAGFSYSYPAYGDFPYPYALGPGVYSQLQRIRVYPYGRGPNGVRDRGVEIGGIVPIGWFVWNAGSGGEGFVFPSDFVSVPYYYVTYIDPNTNRLRLWLYPPLDWVPYWGQRYPDLDIKDFANIDEVGFAKQVLSMEMYPVVAIRENRVDVRSLKTSNPVKYKQTSDMLMNFGVPLDTLTDAYLDSSIENVQKQGNSSVSTMLKDVYFQLGVSPATQAEVVSQALFDFFTRAYKELPNSLNSYFYPYTMSIVEGNLNTYYEWVPREKFTRQNSDVPENTYRHTCTPIPASGATESVTTTVGISYVNYYVPGGGFMADQFGYFVSAFFLEASPPGIYYITNWTTLYGGYFDNYVFDFGGVTFTVNASDIRYIVDNNLRYGTARVTKTMSVTGGNRLTIRHQINPTQEEVINVDNLRSWTGVLAGETRVENALLVNGRPNPNFLIPLSVNFVESMSFMQRTDLLSHCMHMTLYVYSQYHMEYREGGILKNLLKIIGVIITIIISVIAPPAGAALASSGVLATAAMGNILSNIFVNLLIGMALSVALKVIMRVAGGGWLGKLLSAVAIIVSIYVGGGFSNPISSAGDVVKMASKLAEIPAKMIEMSVSQSLQETSEELANLQFEMKDFEAAYKTLAEDYQEILDKMNEGRFGTTTGFLVDLTRMPSLTESIDGRVMSPTAFYEGSIRSQYNYDILYNNDIETYVTRMTAVGLIGE